MCVDVPFGTFDGRARRYPAAGRKTAGASGCALDTRGAMGDGRAHRTLVHVAFCTATPSRCALRTGDGPARAIGTTGSVHSAMSGQSEEAV